jgi:hypothetical protein
MQLLHRHLDRSLISLSVSIFLCLSWSAVATGQQSSCGITELPSAKAKIYPPLAQAAHVSGEVVLVAAFDRDGVVKVTHIISGPEMLKDAATQLVETSKADPSADARECQISISFDLADTHTCDVPLNPAEPLGKTDPQHLIVYGRVVPICDLPATLAKRHSFLFFHWYTHS